VTWYWPSSSKPADQATGELADLSAVYGAGAQLAQALAQAHGLRDLSPGAAMDALRAVIASPYAGVPAVAYRPSGGDDLGALQTLTNSMTAAGGGLIVLGQGAFSFSGAYAPRSKVSVIGPGPGAAVIRLANGVNTHVISNTAAITDVTLARFAIDGNKANNPAGGHNVRLGWGFSDVRLTDLYIHDASLHGIITFDDGADNNRLWVARVRSDANGAAANGSGLYLNRTFGAQIDSYQAAGNSLDGFQWKGGGPVQAAKVISAANGRYGIYATDGATGTVTAAHVSAAAGIGVHVQNGSGGTSLTLDGGQVYDGQVDGIRLDGVANCVLSNLLARNNNKSAGTNAGLRIANGCSYCRVTGSSFYDDQGTHTQKYGIWATGTGSNDHDKILGCDTRGNVTSGFQQDNWGANSTVTDLSQW
jgi:hypothetical protein